MHDNTPADREMGQQDQELNGYLRHMFDSSKADAQAMARIRERLRIASAGPLPAPIPTRETVKPRFQHFKEPSMQISVFKEKPWLQHLSAIAAVILLAALVGSLALLLHMRQANQEIGSSPFTQRTGWSQLALYSGTGSRTITELNVTLPQIWGYSYDCVGNGSMEMKLTGAQTTIDIGKSPCSSTPSATQAPSSLSFDLTPQHIQTIQVTADTSTSWSLLISQQISQHRLVFGKGWVQSTGMGGEGTTMNASEDASIFDASGKKFYPQMWGMVLLCVGTGKVYAQLTPSAQLTRNSSHINFPVCNGQPEFIVEHHPFPSATQTLWVTATGDVIYYVQLLGCAHEQQCTYSSS